ncbi:MAG: helix-turn-helix domain-containing protein [Oligoflexia bacterium]|nr:helix-turn-helix domain-containing protein [Oligoflexia bacterium]
MSVESLLTYIEVSKWSKIPIGTLYSLVSRKIIPHVKLTKRTVRFREKDLLDWLASKDVPSKDSVKK